MSIALVGRSQILAFARFLEQTSTPLNTRYLFINGEDTNPKIDKLVEYRHLLAKTRALYSSLGMEDREDEVEAQSARAKLSLDEYGGEGANAVMRILRNLAPTLPVLDISLNTHIAHMMSHMIHLPHLMDLTMRCAVPLRCDELSSRRGQDG
jgi:hypothetical protein